MVVLRSLRFAFSLLLIEAPTVHAATADCNCDHIVEPGAVTADGEELGILPGDRVCVLAGDYEFIRFSGIQGTTEEPVVIVNCGGLVRIHNDERAYALVMEGDSRHFHITGTGDPSHEYGFDISVPAEDPWPGVGLSLVGRSTDYEVDHLEIHDTGFAGVSAKTDPLCDGSADQDVFVQRNTELHHLYIHDTGGEGFYVGSTQSDGQTISCDGVDEIHQPHFLEGVSLHHNLVENTGWDGMQVGMAHSDCAVYANTIRHVGLEGVEYQQQGLQIGTYSSCEVYNNVLLDGPVMGIIVLGAGPSRFYNNLIVDFGEDGIYAHHREVVAGAGYDFIYNTVVGYGRNGIRAHGAELGPSQAINNLVVGSDGHLAPGSEIPSWTESSNLTFATESEAGFVGPGDYHLRDDSPARAAGAAFDEIDFDLDGRQRADPPSVGAYEHAEDSPGTVGGAGPTPMGPPDSGDTTGGRTPPGSEPEDDTSGSSCACRSAAGGAHGYGTAAFLLVAGCGAWRRRRRGGVSHPSGTRPGVPPVQRR